MESHLSVFGFQPAREVGNRSQFSRARSKSVFFQADQKCPDARRPKEEGNAADGHFSTAG